MACYARWVYHGRPAGGPPAPGATAPKPRAPRPRVIPDRCRHGHALDATNLRFDGNGVRYCRACRYVIEKTYNERQFTYRHDGHDVIPTRDGRRYCRTCNRGEQDVDAVVVERVVSGDRPARVSAAELEAAVVQLRLHQYPYSLIADRAGCSVRHAWWICDRVGITSTREVGA
ncbi:hypothetical protein [Streptomyces lydicus]|uniref:hypothetical protein n=1 Tax=Streptomyces lydicus TaxID=47763 RepID=UPI003717849A